MNENAILESIAQLAKTMEIGFNNIQGQVTDLNTEIVGLKSDVSGLKSDISGMKSDIGGLKSDVGELKSDMDEMKPRVDEIGGMKLRVDEIGETARRNALILENTIGPQLALTLESVTTVSDALRKKGDASKLQALDDNVTLINMAIRRINEEVAALKEAL